MFSVFLVPSSCPLIPSSEVLFSVVRTSWERLARALLSFMVGGDAKKNEPEVRPRYLEVEIVKVFARCHRLLRQKFHEIQESKNVEKDGRESRLASDKFVACLRDLVAVRRPFDDQFYAFWLGGRRHGRRPSQ